MNWQPIDSAPKDGALVHARDADGWDRVTWFEDGGWVYEGWRANDDGDEYQSDEYWEPTEWNAPPNVRAKATAAGGSPLSE